MSGFAYLGRTYTSTVSGTRKKRERCGYCDTAFEYSLRRNGMGNGHSPFLLNNGGAQQTAERRAKIALERAFAVAVEPVHCPRCGMYQPDMVQELRGRFRVRFDPNERAAERLAVPFDQAASRAAQANTAEAYEDLMRVWPVYANEMRFLLRDLRHPVRRKILRALWWTLWVAIAGSFLLLVVMSFLGDHKIGL